MTSPKYIDKHIGCLGCRQLIPIGIYNRSYKSHRCPEIPIITPEDAALVKYYMDKSRRPDFHMTIHQVRDKLDEAGITALDIGRSDGGYQLARYGDTGPYSVDNCRFITQLDNLKERDSKHGWGKPKPPKVPSPPKVFTCCDCGTVVNPYPSNNRKAPKRCRPCNSLI